MSSSRWTILVVADDGDEASIEANKNSHLRQLLDKAVRELYGNDRNSEEYELVFKGAAQNLDSTLEQAGLHDGAEVVVQPKDVSKG